jgi:NitT/TauT family transport system permease protein
MTLQVQAAPDHDSTSRLLDGLILVAVLLAAWQILYAMVGDIALTSPSDTFGHAMDILSVDWFRPHLAATLTAFSGSFAIAAFSGVLIGLALGFHHLSGEVAEPILAALYSIPKVTLYPIILLLFGLGLSAKVAFGVIHGVIPIIIFTLNAVRNINPVHLRTARALRLRPSQTVWHVLAPAVLPEIMTGLRVGFGLTLLGVVIGEMFASQHGMGFIIIRGVNVHNVKDMCAVILLFVLFSAGSNMLLLWLERKLNPGG